MLQGRPDLADLPLLTGWARLGRPVIVCCLPGDAAHDVPATLAASPPVRLWDAAVAAPADWQRVIASLIGASSDAGIEPCVLGALLWQHVTGLPYVTTRSDLYLL